MPCYVTPIHLHNPLNGTICPILIHDFAKNCIFYASFGASLLLLRERLIRLKPWNMIPLLAMTLLFDPALKPTLTQIFYNLFSVHLSCFLDKGLIFLKFHYWPWPCHLIPPWSQTASQPQTKPASTSIWSWGKGSFAPILRQKNSFAPILRQKRKVSKKTIPAVYSADERVVVPIKRRNVESVETTQSRPRNIEIGRLFSLAGSSLSNLAKQLQIPKLSPSAVHEFHICIWNGPDKCYFN